MENLHLKNLDIDKILKKIKPNDDYINEDDDDFEYDDDSWEWTDEDDEDMKYIRRERLLMKLMYIIPIIMWIILVITIMCAR